MTIETLAKQGRDKIYTGLAGIDTQRLKAMRNASLRACFSRLEETRYRMEFVARVRGREYINDAASRSINSTWYTLESMQGGLIWVADAPQEEADYSRLVPAVLRKVRMLLIVGGDAPCMRKAFGGIVPAIATCPTMADALQRAYRYESDDVKVLYSPACDNGIPVDELGDRFRHEVNEL
jgi:UDP-N-acetylmuramoylalanine-D-glutamate ligase